MNQKMNSIHKPCTTVAINSKVTGGFKQVKMHRYKAQLGYYS